MTYYESAGGMMIPHDRARQELRRHGVWEFEEFFADLGNKPEYDAQKVLAWLGY